MLALLIAYQMQLLNHPIYTQSTPGMYIEAVRHEYVKSENTTYIVLERYDVDPVFGPHVQWTQTVPVAGNVSDMDLLNSQSRWKEVTPIPLQK